MNNDYFKEIEEVCKAAEIDWGTEVCDWKDINQNKYVFWLRNNVVDLEEGFVLYDPIVFRTLKARDVFYNKTVEGRLI